MVDLRAILPTIRDQGDRGTCLSLAISDAHAAARGLGEPMSADYLHFFSTRRDGTSMNDGTSMDAVMAALLEDGQPAEELCPYSMIPRPLGWEPVENLAPLWTHSSQILANDFAKSAEDVIRSGRPCVANLMLNEAFVRSDGIKMVSLDGADLVIHAVLIVGLRQEEEGLRFLIRNSWGSEWGVDGHGWLTAEYLNQRTRLLLCLIGENRA